MYRSFDFDEPDVEVEIQLRQESTGYTMRPYQATAANNVFDRWAAGDRSTLVAMPTGTGKTVLFSEVMRRYAESN